MKICPQCGREYDDTMSFCLDDGVVVRPGGGERARDDRVWRIAFNRRHLVRK